MFQGSQRPHGNPLESQLTWIHNHPGLGAVGMVDRVWNFQTLTNPDPLATPSCPFG